MICYRQAVGVYKMAVLHTKLCRPLIHSFHENFFAACHILGQGHTAVIGTGHGHSLHKLCYGVCLSGLHVHLAASHGRCPLGNGHLIIQGYFTFINCIHNKKHSHYFGNRCQRQLLVGILLKKHFSRFGIYEHRSLCRHFKSRLRLPVFRGLIIYCFQHYRFLGRQTVFDFFYTDKGTKYQCNTYQT